MSMNHLCIGGVFLKVQLSNNVFPLVMMLTKEKRKNTACSKLYIFAMTKDKALTQDRILILSIYFTYLSFLVPF